MKSQYYKIVSFLTDEDTGIPSTTLVVLGLGAITIPATVFFLMAFVWS